MYYNSWVVHESLLRIIKKQKNWIPVEQYKDKEETLIGEVGKFGSVRIVLSQTKGVDKICMK